MYYLNLMMFVLNVMLSGASGWKRPYELACVDSNRATVFLNGLWILRHGYD